MMTNAGMDLGRAPLGETLAPPLDDGARPNWKAVYTIADRGNGRKHWLRIGVAFINRDQSLNVRLDAMPVNGQLHIREALPREVPAGRGDGDERGRDDFRGEYGNA